MRKRKNDALVNPKTARAFHYLGLCHCVGTFASRTVGTFFPRLPVAIILLTAVYQSGSAGFFVAQMLINGKKRSKTRAGLFLCFALQDSIPCTSRSTKAEIFFLCATNWNFILSQCIQIRICIPTTGYYGN